MNSKTNLSCGQAIELLENGFEVSREAWEGEWSMVRKKDKTLDEEKFPYDMNLTKHDIIAKDWFLVVN